MRRPILLNWQANNTYGWGLLGLNILTQWATDPEVAPLMGFPIGDADVQGIDPLRMGIIEPVARVTNSFLAALAQTGEPLLTRMQILTVEAMGNGFVRCNPERRGIRNIGRCIFEDTRPIGAREGLAPFDAILCASNWNARMLESLCSKPVVMIHEGIDHSMFFPGPRSGAMNPGRFYVFSGGKLEYRKAQDLVILAFREFARRHDDAVLVTAWHSPWPQLAAGFRGRLQVPLRTDESGRLEIGRWAVENGIRSEQFVELPPLANQTMPFILREMDCALQVSRAEACTNLPAKEAMACGTPVILADNTGVKDLIDADNCVPLRHQVPVVPFANSGTDGWGESSVDEIVAALERLYTDTRLRRSIGARGADWIVERGRTWRDHSLALKRYLLGMC